MLSILNTVAYYKHMTDSEREFKHWITKHCDRKQCWLVVAKLGEMLLHKDTVITGPNNQPVQRDQLALTHDSLEYVYTVYLKDGHLLALIQDKGYYYLLDNKEIIVKEGEEETKDYKSSITYDTSLSKLINRITSSNRKKLALKHKDKIKLKQSEKRQLQGVVPIDFIGKSHPVQVKLFRDFIKQNPKRLDLSGFYLLEPQVITDTAVWGKMNFTQEEVILYQNNRFHKFEWLKYFPKVKTLSLWYINQVQDSDIDMLVASAQGLEILEFHYCFQLTGRVLIPISKLPILDKLIISNTQCSLQEQTFETVISDKEWSKLENTSVTLALIDSHNLTLDFIDFFLRSFKSVEHFIMNEIMLGKLEKNSADGGKDRETPVSFHSIADTTVGFKRYRDVRIYDLVRNKTGNTFSSAMLKKIKERSPEKSDAAEILMPEN